MTPAETVEYQIQHRQALLWDAIKALPNTTFKGESESLRAIADIGRMAEQIMQLRQTAFILREWDRREIDKA